MGFKASAIISGFRKSRVEQTAWRLPAEKNFVESCLDASVVDTIDASLARCLKGNLALNDHEQPHERGP